MHARKTVVKGSPEKVGEADRVIKSHVIPRAKELDGFRGGYWLIDRATGEVVSFTFFETQEHLAASAAGAAQIRSEGTRQIGAEVASVDEFEVALDTGQKVHQGANFARVVHFEGDPNAITMIEENVLPRARELTGFLGGFWLFDRSATKGVGVTLFDSAEHLASSREAAAGIRAQSAQRSSGRIGEFKEYEVLDRAETPASAAAR